MMKPRYRVAATSSGEVLSLVRVDRPALRMDGEETGLVTPDSLRGVGARAAYQGASMKAPRMSRWLPNSMGPNATLQWSLPALRARSRERRRNDSIANQVIDVLVSELIGTGVKPRFKTDDEKFNKRQNQLFNDWTAESDADARYDFYGQQALAVSSMLEGGDMFTRLRPRDAEDELTVPLQLQLLEGEFCPVEMSRDLPGGGWINQGIEFGPIANRTAYYLYRVHPNDLFAKSVLQAGIPVRVPAEQVIHLADIMPRRAGRLRGEPWFVRLLIKLLDLDQYDDAQLMRQKIAALFTAFTKNMQGDPFADEDEDAETATKRVGEVSEPALEPGTVQDLDAGEDIEFTTPPGPGESYDPYMTHQERRVAAGGSVSYEALTGDFRFINDRTYRASMNILRRRYQLMQWQFVHQWCRPVATAWMNMGVISGEIKLPRGMTVMDVVKRVQWSPQRWEYINPLQDIQALTLERRGGYASRDMQCAERGDDVEDIDTAVMKENERADADGLIYDTDSRYTNAKGVAQQASVEVETQEGGGGAPGKPGSPAPSGPPQKKQPVKPVKQGT